MSPRWLAARYKVCSTHAPWYDAGRAPGSEFVSSLRFCRRALPSLLPSLIATSFAGVAAVLFPVTRTSIPAQPDEVPTAGTTGKAKRKTLSIVARNLLMVAVGVLVFAIVAGVVLYGPITYGDPIPNFGIILMLTVPVIAGVAFRVGLDAWLDRS